MIDFTHELNQEQLAVVYQGNGPCLVLAGAGSGKTRTITYRVACLLEQGIKPEEILLVTFTNKAAEEMKARVQKLVAGGVLPWSGTFHHIGYRILRIYAPLLGYGNNFSVLDSDDSESILKLCIKETKTDLTGKRFPSAHVIGAIISYARNAEISLEEVLESRFPQWTHFVFELQEINRLYAQRKKEANAMDFDDLLSNLLLLLQQERIRQKYASQFKYVLVDEYQDTNKIQASIIKQFASEHKNVLVVGDDAQSIYSFRAADIHNILGFELQYPGAKVFKLETNYRSSQEILEVANTVIANNHEQYQKELRAVIKNGVKPELWPQIDQQSEGQFVAKKIAELLEQGTPPQEIAILFRASHHSQMLEVELVQRGIEYDYRGGVRFFDRAHIKDILAYLRILTNLADTAAWLRVLMHEEGIGPAAAQKVIERVRGLSVILSDSEGSLSQTPTDRDPSVVAKLSQGDSDGLAKVKQIGVEILGGKAQAGWNNFVQIWDRLLTAPVRTPKNLIESLLQSPYRDYLDAEFVDSRDRLADIKQLAVFAERYDNLEEFLGGTTLQESFKTITDGEKQTAAKDKIVLSTIHQAKGLEWTAVFIINLSAGGFPSDRALKEANGLEEERRLFYVAITRAKKFLYLTYPMAGGAFGDFLSGPSLFLNEIEPGLIKDHSLLSTDTTVFDDAAADVHYISEDSPPPRIRPGSFLRDLADL